MTQLRTAVLSVSLCSLSISAFAQGHANLLPPNHINPKGLSQGAQMWWFGPQPTTVPIRNLAKPVSWPNVDAASTNEDLAAGQSETAIGAATNRVMAAWNDATAFFVTPTTNPQASGTGVGFSHDGGKTFKDLVGLPNNNSNEKWSGDPSVVAVDNGAFFIVSSLYLPVLIDCTQGPAQYAIAVSVATVTPNSVLFSNPVIAATGGDYCSTTGPTAFLDKDFMKYDPVTRTLALSYTRFSFFGFGFGTGQIEVVKAQVPASPPFLSSADFSAPIVVWPEEPVDENEGAYLALAYNSTTAADDIYVSWERNWGTNQFDGDPYVYIYAAEIVSGTNPPLIIGTPAAPIVVSLGQLNSTATGGVKSLDLVPIAGYNRGTGNDFPRIAWDATRHRVAIVWNDASHHPLGDIFMRVYSPQFTNPGSIEKLNSDNKGALHFMPAVCFLTDGSMVTSWYDRRNYPADSAMTDYFGDIRPAPYAPAANFQITTAPTDWANTSSIIIPNFGDYTDNACTGTSAYFTWSDGRLGVPQPFVAP